VAPGARVATSITSTMWRKSMNVRLRFLGVATLVSLVSATTSLAAQSAVQSGSVDTAAFPAPASAPSLLEAERAARNGPADSASTIARGPTVASARVAAHQRSTSRGAAPVIQNRTSNRNAVALMIVGGAALVIGAVIGDDAGTLVMLGGAAVGLYGLYMFLT
jgi:hypothetical protein